MEEKMRKTNARKACIHSHKVEQNTYRPACETLKKARMLMGISKERLSARMGVQPNMWAKYENGALRIHDRLMLKIFTFGLDFWCERDL